jgi:2-iminoacetate synthase
MGFDNIIDKYNWDEVKSSIYAKTQDDVELALKKEILNLEDFKALVSPAATPFLEQMANISRNMTLKRFGNTMQMFIPLYLSNECTNHCVYCGFNHENDIARITLTDEQIIKELEVIKSYGFGHILLVTGESPRKCGLDYIKHVFELIKPHFSLISIEVQPMEAKEYEELIELGLHSVYVYQETYNRATYKSYHPKGKKSDYAYRLDTPDRLGHAGVHKIGLGFLIGLEDWRTEAFFNVLHLKYLEKTYWKTKYSISFPRLRPHVGSFNPNYPINERELVQLITAYRLINENVDLSMSVRENQKFRDNIIQMGITSISAGSKTEPGGYSSSTHSLEQFEVHDNRSPQEFADVIRSKGYEPVWKDWDQSLQ